MANRDLFTRTPSRIRGTRFPDPLGSEVQRGGFFFPFSRFVPFPPSCSSDFPLSGTFTDRWFFASVGPFRKTRCALWQRFSTTPSSAFFLLPLLSSSRRHFFFFLFSHVSFHSGSSPYQTCRRPFSSPAPPTSWPYPAGSPLCRGGPEQTFFAVGGFPPQHPPPPSLPRSSLSGTGLERRAFYSGLV